MSTGFAARLAWSNLGKNRLLCLPQILTGTGLCAVFYIILTLAGDQRLHAVRGGSYLPDIMFLGVMVMAVLSVILLFYTSRFLMRQRRREFGLYNVLGMEKRHVGRVLFFETAFSALLSILSGLVLGVVFYKLCSLLICRIFQVESVLGFDYLRPFPLLAAALFFGGVYLLTYAFDLIQIARLRPVELLHSTQTGEREPKVQWPILAVGLASLGAGYFIALTTKSPLEALDYFFLAVLLVILGTYCLFFTGTIALLRLLKGRRSLYYRKGNMVAVSGLLYRMRQNAVSLASITILATGVLVMVSTTVSLYAGIASTLERQFPHPMYFWFSYADTDGAMKSLPFEVQAGFAQKAAGETGLTISFLEEETHLTCTYRHRDGALALRNPSGGYDKDTCNVFFLTAQEYEKLSGEALGLTEDQCAVYTLPGSSKQLEDTFTLTGQTFTVKERLTSFPASMGSYFLLDSYGVVVADEAVFQRICQEQQDAFGSEAVLPTTHILLDFTDREQAEQAYRRFWMSMGDQMQAYVEAQPDAEGGWGSASDSVWDAAEELYGLDGTLLFLGLILTVVFLFATALILYYKQITEGLDDRERYQILQKVGMSREEVHRTIHSQLLLVIALPLAVSAVHISVAFPMLVKLLRVLLNGDAKLFLLCTVGAFGAFTAVYLGLYRATARVYEGIVR